MSGGYTRPRPTMGNRRLTMQSIYQKMQLNRVKTLILTSNLHTGLEGLQMTIMIVAIVCLVGYVKLVKVVLSKIHSAI